MMLQFEITTRCNFDCFYCAGRAMRQGDMPYSTFTGLLDRYIASFGVPASVSLQGEGEPTLHKEFFEMAQYIRAAGSTPYTITNGTYKHPERFFGLFPRVGVSVDTLDESVAHVIGRYNLPRVLSFIETLAPHTAIVVHSVEGPTYNTPRVAAWCAERGYRHIIQPLQRKPDYSRNYLPDAPPPVAHGHFSCHYLARPLMRYYTLDGLELPCCFIKETREFEGIDAMIRHQARGTWPAVCLGCQHACRVDQRPSR
jgi:MoaA/NifB/PqqE/SkfB family radical SAM enzyme